MEQGPHILTDAVYSHWPLSSSNPRHTPAQKNWTELIIKPALSLQFKVGRKKRKDQYGQKSCLENPRDGGACWAAIYVVAQSRTRLKRLSSSSK